MKTRLTLGLALALAAGHAAAGLLPDDQSTLMSEGYAMSGYAVEGQKSAADQRAAMAELHAWLLSEAVLDDRAKGLVAALDRNDRILLGLEACTDCNELQNSERRFQVGVGKPVGQWVDFSELATKHLRGVRTFAEGALQGTVDGGLVWTIKLASPGAAGLRIGLSGLDLPANAALYAFNDRGEAFGPYVDKGAQASGELVTHMLSGDQVYLQLRVSGAPKQLERLRFRIDDIGFISGKFDLARQIDATHRQDKTHCTSGVENAGCVENAQCYGTGDLASINNLRKAIGAMLYRSGGSYYICTGGLIANTANRPMFLTANHCISKGAEASSLEVYWNHTVSCGTRSCDYGWSGGRTSDIGASILASNRTGDYTLMELASTLPSGAYALGWNSTAVANSNNTALYRISHPSGAPQAFSTQNVNTSAGVCGTLPRGSYIYSTDDIGATEGGSSGSPVVNANGEIVGQLYGACGTNLNDVCDSGSNATVDGAFAGYFSAVQPHLTADGGGGGGGGGFELTGVARKAKGTWNVNLSWSGSSAGNIDVFRNNSKLATVSNSGKYTDATGLRGSASFSYQVCNAGTTTCSNTITVSF